MNKNNFSLFNYNFEQIKEQMNKFDSYDELFAYFEYVTKECLIEAESKNDVVDFLRLGYSGSHKNYINLANQITTEYKYIRDTKFKNMIPEEIKAEPKNPEFKQSQKELNKFTWNDTEENIILLFNFLNQAGLINDKDFVNIGVILRDTFLNKKGKPFDNKQINVKKDEVLNLKKLTTKKNQRLLYLYEELKKLIPD